MAAAVQAELAAINRRFRPGTSSADYIGFLQRGVDALNHTFHRGRRSSIAEAFGPLIDFCSQEENRHRSRVPEARAMAAAAVRAFRNILAEAHPFMDPSPLCEVLGEFLLEIIKHAFLSGQRDRMSKKARVKKMLSPIKKLRERRQQEEFNARSREQNVKELEEMRDELAE